MDGRATTGVRRLRIVADEEIMYGYRAPAFKPNKKPRKPNKKPRKLTHEQKRQFAKEIVAGGMIKQTAANWHISLNLAYGILADYTILLRTEKYPEDPNYE